MPALQRGWSAPALGILVSLPAIPRDFDPFRPATRGEKVVEICQGLSCREVGSHELLRALESLTGVKAGQTAADGSLTLLGVPCFGRCAIGANARVSGRFCHNLAPSDAAQVLQGPAPDA